MLYVYDQNNSGGSFHFNAEKGISHRVLIEADTEAEAEEKALLIGIYFDGCEKGLDCPCCGDRWSSWTHEVTNLETFLEGVKDYTWLTPDVFVHYKTGEIKGYLEG